MLLNSALFSNVIWLVPMLVRLRFGAADDSARDWQTTLVTAAIPTFMVLSIFWNELLRRVSLRTYLLIFWLTAALPLGLIGAVRTYPQLLLCHIPAMIGWAGWMPVGGKLLKDFYSDAIRGRVYAVLNVVGVSASIASIYFVGGWLAVDPDAFRLFLPAAAAMQLVAVAIIWRLARRLPNTGGAQPTAAPWNWSLLVRPVLHMGEVLRADHVFRRYEQAFMTYGAAYMLCDALLPVLATTKLGMEYRAYAYSTQMILKGVTLVLTLPMGWLLDRIGAVRTSGLVFAVLAFYPLLLLAADTPTGVGVASAVYGVGMAGVSLSWLLGPVALAGRAERVPHYVAIHTTLVGVRGVLFQGLGMLIYRLTGSFTWPLLISAGAFVWAAGQMWRLHRATRPAA
jgi:MFS family permease